ncbi:PrpF domain-containing protein, partial [Arsenicibacter rosenii]|uniref:PrpF domain-containing protein n=1 Tax=Arsenicibacter rosenii TaxID=1750698 RepID=UPI00286DFAE6
MQRAIPYMQFRGGSSKGIFFLAADLPADPVIRNRVVLAVMEGLGEGDTRQIDGMGGGTTLTSKVAIVGPAGAPEADLAFYFLQVVVGKGTVSDTQSCGNLLAAVVPFAIEKGLLPVTGPTTSARVSLVNTGGICEV